jgi:polysaccharide export outer membrane protein
VVGVVLLLASAMACAKPGAIPPPPEVAGERMPYVIGVADALRITVWKNPDLGVMVRVRPDGMISVPLLDDVQAEGLTPQELKEVLTEEFAEFIAAPDVTVVVLEMNSRVVYLLGEGVARNGALPLNREMRVLEAITTMGGFTIWARKNRVRILRRSRTGLVEYTFNYGAYLSGKSPDSNILLKPDDTIVVED